jgi:hypothetical protein
MKTLTPSRRDQHGAAALTVTMLLLFGMALVAFFSNRGLIFEQRTSANQVRSTKAFEAAEAGLEWAVARLNDRRRIAATPSCAISTTTTGDFADRYLQMSGSGFTINTAQRFGCSFDSTTGLPTCSCPNSGDPTLGAAGDARFTVRFNTVSGDPWSVEILSYGCTNAAAAGGVCDPATSTNSDAIAVVRAIHKMKPALPNAPGAGLVTGALAITGGNLNVINKDVASNGITINAGGDVELGTGTNVYSLDGSPPRSSVLDNDPTLAALTAADSTGDVFFATFFGETIDNYKNNPTTFYITSGTCPASAAGRCASCSTNQACGTAVSNAIDTTNFSRFWSDTDVAFGASNLPTTLGGTLGSSTRPISIASSASVELKANITAYGMFYAATAAVDDEWDYSGSGTAKVYGAFVSRSTFDKGSGTLDLIYDANIFGPGSVRGTMIRVPGSWRDRASEY